MRVRSETSLKQTISDLRRVLTKLERIGLHDTRPIDQMITDALEDCGPLSTSAVRRLIRRSRPTVQATLKLMVAANRIIRLPNGKWTLIEEADHVV